jgi:diguanylate cyclase (GGDEF)-like protein/PAS domain S-box-containing protein
VGPAPRAAVPRSRDAHDQVLIGLGVGTLLSCAWILVGPAVVSVSWFVQIVLDVVFALGSYRVAGLVGPGPTRRFWRAMAIGGVFFTVADTFQLIYTLGDDSGVATNSTVQTLLVAAGVGTVVLAMLTHPLRVAGRERLRLWLDAATTMAAVAVFAWAVSFEGTGIADVITGLTGSGLMLVSAFGMVKLLLSGTAPFTIRAGVVGGVSSALAGVGTSLNPVLADTSVPELVTIARLLPTFLLAATPRIQELQMRRDPASLAPRHRPYSRLPYVAVAATQCLLLYLVAAHGLTARTWGVLVGGVLITSLVVVRQLVAFQDNAQLLGQLRRQEQRFRSLVQHASDITLVIDGQGYVTYASPALQRILQVPVIEVVGARLEDLLHPEDVEAAQRALGELRQAPGAGLTVQLRGRSGDGGWRWLEVVGTNLLGDPSVEGIVFNARDVTESKQLHDQLQHEATHDPLTQLANRSLFGERLRLATMARPAAAEPADQLTVIAIDLDRFKEVNDSLGHHVGDELLVAAAERLRRSVRPSDTVARLGGDEFAVLLPHTPPAGARVVADRITAAFAEPVVVEGHAIPIRASLGIAGGPSRDTEALLKAADAAMYAAKRDSARHDPVGATGRR